MRSSLGQAHQIKPTLAEKSLPSLRISKIALYRDRQPILGLRKRYFTAGIHEKHQNYGFVPASERDINEQPIGNQETVECPLCKRRFDPGVFAEIHNSNEQCRRVFI